MKANRSYIKVKTDALISSRRERRAYERALEKLKEEKLKEGFEY